MTSARDGAGLWALAPDGVPRVASGDDLGAILAPVLARLVWPDGSLGLAPGDVVVVASKIVAKAEGRLIAARSREEAVDSQSVRVVASREHADGSVLKIVQTPQGIVMAAAGVDSSNVPPGTVLLLPQDPDASARRLRRGLAARLGGLKPGVVVTDTVGRPWRAGIADIAIGAAGIAVLEDLRGGVDDGGRPLQATVRAIADEIAAAADLVKGKTAGRPVAVLRGMGWAVQGDDGPGAGVLNRTGEADMFSRGSREAYEDGYRAGYEAGSAS